MLKVITDSYKMFLKNFPVILLYSLPLIALSIIDLSFKQIANPGKGILYFATLATILIPFVSAATDVAIYKFLLKLGKINPFASWKIYFLYMFSQLAIGLVAVLPIFAFKFIFDNIGLENHAMLLALILNMFFGIYLLSRLNVILPLIIKGQEINLKAFWKNTDNTYANWMSVATLVYLPFLILNYGIINPYANSIITILFMYVFVTFNICYVSKRMLKADAPKTMKDIQIQIIQSEVICSKPIVEAKPEPKLSTPKKVSKSPAPQKASANKAKPAKENKPVKSKSSATTKKTVAPKKPKTDKPSK